MIAGPSRLTRALARAAGAHRGTALANPRLPTVATSKLNVERNLLLLILLTGLALRLPLLPLVPSEGPRDIVQFWIPWLERVVQSGIIEFYRHPEAMGSAPALDYPPLFIALLDLLGHLAQSLLPNGLSSAVEPILTKLPGIAADVALAVLIYRSAGPLAAALWFLNPAIIYNSAWWGQIDSLLCLWLAGAVILAARGAWLQSGAVLALGLLTKVQALVAIPVLFSLAVASGAGALLTAMAATFAVFGLALLPFLIFGGFDQILEIYSGAVGYYPFPAMGALNFWALLQWADQHINGYASRLIDTTPIFGDLNAFQIGLAALSVFVLLVCLALTLRLRLQRRWPGGMLPPAAFASAALYIGFFNLPTEMHERYVLPALAFLPLASLVERKRLLILIGLSITTFINLLIVEPPTHQLQLFFAAHLSLQALVSGANVALFFGVLADVVAGLRRSWRLVQGGPTVAAGGETGG